MTWITDLWGREPVVVTGLVSAVLALLVSFNVHIAPEQLAAIDAVILAVGLVIARSKVSPV